MRKQLLRIDETSELLQISRWTIYRWVNEGRLAGEKNTRTGTLRIRAESVDSLIANNIRKHASWPTTDP